MASERMTETSFERAETLLHEIEALIGPRGAMDRLVSPGRQRSIRRWLDIGLGLFGTALEDAIATEPEAGATGPRTAPPGPADGAQTGLLDEIEAGAASGRF